MLISIYRKYLNYFERPCSHGMAMKTWRHERIIFCICDQQVSFGQIMFSSPNKIFPVRRWIHRPLFVAPYHLLAPKWAGWISSYGSLFHFEVKNSCQSGKPLCPTELSVMNLLKRELPKLVSFIFRQSLSFFNIRTNSQPGPFRLVVQTVLNLFK